MPRRLINQPREKEAAAQVRLLNALERRFQPLFLRELNRATKVMLGEARNGQLPKLPEDHKVKLAEIEKRLVNAATIVFAGRLNHRGKSVGAGLETKDFGEFVARVVEEFLQTEFVRQRITNLANKTREVIIEALQAATAEGVPIREAAKRVEPLLVERWKGRANTIARTELHGAANYASLQSSKEMGLPMLKEWVSTEDHRTREAHQAADGQKQPLGQVFIVDDEALMYPGDPSGSGHNVINCRCGMVFELDLEDL